MGQAHQDVARPARPGCGRRFQNGGDLLVVQAGDDGRGHHPAGDTGGAQFTQRLEPPPRGRGPWLHSRRQRGGDRGDREVDAAGLESVELHEQVEVAGDQVVLRDDRHRVAELGQDLQTAPRDPELSLDRLVRVGDAGEHDDLGFPARAQERLSQQFRRTVLDQYPALEVQSGGETEVLVRGTGVAVDAAVLAAAVGVQAVLEADVGRVVAREDRLRVVPEQLGRRRLAAFGKALARFEVDVEPFEAVAGVDGGASAAHCARGSLPGVRPAGGGTVGDLHEEGSLARLTPCLRSLAGPEAATVAGQGFSAEPAAGCRNLPPGRERRPRPCGGSGR